MGISISPATGIPDDNGGAPEDAGGGQAPPRMRVSDGTDAFGGPLDARLVRRADGGSTIVLHDHVAAVVGCGIAVTRGRACWKCGAQRQDVGVGVWMRDLDGADEAFVLPFHLPDLLNMVDDACMRRNEPWTHVRRTWSNDANGFYYANTCPACGTLQGDTFIFLDRGGQGGGFSNPAYQGEPVDWYDVPPLLDSRYHDQRWLGASPAIRRIPTGRITVHPRIAWNWSGNDVVYE